MCRLTAEGVRLSRSAARAKVPWRAMVTRVRKALRDMRVRSGFKLTELHCQARPYRRQASSHRFGARLRKCAVPVGAGKPATPA